MSHELGLTNWHHGGSGVGKTTTSCAENDLGVGKHGSPTELVFVGIICFCEYSDEPFTRCSHVDLSRSTHSG